MSSVNYLNEPEEDSPLRLQIRIQAGDTLVSAWDPEKKSAEPTGLLTYRTG